MSLEDRIVAAWYREARWLKLFRPLSILYRYLVNRRRQHYHKGKKTVWRAPVPVIVVGNITVGGTGKSPLVAWLARFLKERGWRPGILSRGYGGRSEVYPLLVTDTTAVEACGDEPAMLAAQTGVPVMVDPDRPRGARRLLEENCNILLSDDGLQHLALGRDIELVVVDGERGFGNRRCLPEGPLREPLSRLATVDALIVNGKLRVPPSENYFTMALVPIRWRYLRDDSIRPVTPLPFAREVHAVAGIGNPARFFATLEALGLEPVVHGFADHHRYRPQDLRFDGTPDQSAMPIVMTAKDAVKCRGFADERYWALEIEAQPNQAFIDWLSRRLDMLTQQCER
ncbi:tetraacyldisaccharide 4'-kinase [Pistricoccus aurantiacus]|uniref:tetraacyldisaccharide 4'-kinase n=1 Tax=Pistricoccus aurantiacus TaxID=1883414 RepID=UPI00362EC23B